MSLHKYRLTSPEAVRLLLNNHMDRSDAVGEAIQQMRNYIDHIVMDLHHTYTRAGGDVDNQSYVKALDCIEVMRGHLVTAAAQSTGTINGTPFEEAVEEHIADEDGSGSDGSDDGSE